jgi:DNA-binding transcriptional LysR family regulator
MLSRLEGFYWVARTGGYASAARAFPYPITEPGVHQQVRRLEEELGARVFERVGKGTMQLTPAGRALHDLVAPFLEDLGALSRALRAGSYGGTLRIHAAGLFVRQLLPGWLRRLSARRPDIELEVHEAPSADLEPLRRGDTDILVEHLPEVPPDILTRKIAVVRPFIALPARHAVAKRARWSLADLKTERFISYPPGGHRDLQYRALALQRIEPKRVLVASTVEAILGMVQAGLGFSIVPSIDKAGPKLPGIVTRALVAPGSELPVYAAWRNSGITHPLVEAALGFAPKG